MNSNIQNNQIQIKRRATINARRSALEFVSKKRTLVGLLKYLGIRKNLTGINVSNIDDAIYTLNEIKKNVEESNYNNYMKNVASQKKRMLSQLVSESKIKMMNKMNDDIVNKIKNERAQLVEAVKQKNDDIKMKNAVSMKKMMTQLVDVVKEKKMKKMNADISRLNRMGFFDYIEDLRKSTATYSSTVRPAHGAKVRPAPSYTFTPASWDPVVTRIDKIFDMTHEEIKAMQSTEKSVKPIKPIFKPDPITYTDDRPIIDYDYEASRKLQRKIKAHRVPIGVESKTTFRKNLAKVLPQLIDTVRQKNDRKNAIVAESKTAFRKNLAKVLPQLIDKVRQENDRKYAMDMKMVQNNAISKYARQYEVFPNEYNRIKREVFINGCIPYIESATKHAINTLNSGVLIRTCYHAVFVDLEERDYEDGNDADDIKNGYKKKIFKHLYFWSNKETFLSDIDVSDKYIKQTIIRTIFNKLERVGGGSSLIFHANVSMNTHVMKYNALGGSSYIELPSWLSQNKNASIINIKNDDQRCFEYCCIAYLNPAKDHPNRPSNYKEQPKKEGGRPAQKLVLNNPYTFNFDGIDFPVKCDRKTITKIEDQNIGYSFNIFAPNEDDTRCIVPLVITQKNCEHVINLLYWGDGDKCHYALIGNLNSLLYGKNAHHEKKHICMTCLHPYSSETALKNHVELGCAGHGQVTRMPKDDEAVCEFKSHSKKIKCPFVFYSDFESILKKVDDTTQNKYQEHQACSYQIYRSCSDKLYNKLYDRVISDDHDKLAKKFIDDIMKYGYDAKELSKIIPHPGVTKSNYNSYIEKMKVPVVFHNLTGYDSHLIIKAYERSEKLECIPNTSEKYISFSMGNTIKFIDSCRFLSSSLENLVFSLIDNPTDKSKKYIEHDKLSDIQKTQLLLNISKKCKHTLRHMGLNVDDVNDHEKILLMVQKGVYPYDYMCSNDKFNDAKLPSKNDFYNLLNKKHISDSDYERATKVWNIYEMKTMRDYHDLYLRSDVLLLADVFDNFRELSLNIYELDPANYYTAPGLAWDAALLMSGVQLDLFTEQDMHLFIENGLRGGMSTAVHRYSNVSDDANKSDALNELKKSIMYLDANNLYGWAMCQNMPVRNYKWEDVGEWTVDRINGINDDSSVGYIFEVDLQYPESLHDLHNDYPLAPEHMKVKKGMLSQYNKDVLSATKTSFLESNKLIANLNDKQNYVVHYRALKLYIQLGLKVTSIKRVLSFDQEPWLKKYIMKNTDLRSKTNSSFEKDFYKLMNNAVFGKTMENVRKHEKYVFVTTKKELMFQSAKPTCAVNHDIYNDNLIGMYMEKGVVYLNKPIAVGMSILDLSKVLMYDFHYNTMKPLFNDGLKLLLTDTDSLVYELTCEDLNAKLLSIIDNLDTADYPKDHILYSSKNNKVVGKFKSVTGAKPIIAVTAIKSKMYKYVCGDDTKIVAKGIKKCAQKDIKGEDFDRCILSDPKCADPNDLRQRTTFNVIRSSLHTLYSEIVNKVSLSAYDDKRYILPDCISTLAYGHKNIPK